MAAQETVLALFSSVSRWRYAFELGYRQTAPTGGSPDEPFRLSEECEEVFQPKSNKPFFEGQIDSLSGT